MSFAASIPNNSHVAGETRRHRGSAWPRMPRRPTNQNDNRNGHSYLATSLYNYNSPYLAEVDQDLLSRAIQDSGLHAFGSIMVELWVVSSDGKHVVRPSGGHWMDPSFSMSAPDPHQAREVDRIAPDCAPGESLAGTLYKEVTKPRKVHWRQIKSMMEDPFIQKGKDSRIEQMYNIGIGIVAAVPFHLQERRGIVMFMSRATADIEKLQAHQNEQYLVAATDFIGNAFALRVPRMECARKRREIFQSAVAKVQRQINPYSDKPSFASIVMEASELHKKGELNHTSSAHAEQAQDQSTSFVKRHSERWKRRANPRVVSFCNNITFQVKHYIIEGAHTIENSFGKWKGAGLHRAPRQSLFDSLIAFTGVFCVFLALVRLDYFLRETLSRKDSDYLNPWTFDPVWYTSSLCIIFSLTGAPNGQPSMIICAHLWNALVGLAFQQIPTGHFHWYNSPDGERVGLPEAWKLALSVAFGVSGQAYLGIIHPPATGLSFSFANSSRWSASNILLILLGDVVMILMSVVILNLSKFKQYPLFWVGMSWRNSGGYKQSWRRFSQRWDRTEQHIQHQSSSDMVNVSGSVAIDIENTRALSSRPG